MAHGPRENMLVSLACPVQSAKAIYMAITESQPACSKELTRVPKLALNTHAKYEEDIEDD